MSIRVLPLIANNRITQDVDMVTARINYRFGGYGGPVVARVLTSRYFDFSSKLGRQKCRPFLLEVTCLKNPSGPRPAHNRTNGKPLPIA